MYAPYESVELSERTWLLTDQDDIFLVRVTDDLRSDVNHISILASVCIAVIALIFLYVVLSFLGSVGYVLSANGGLDRFNLSTDVGSIVMIIGAALFGVTLMVCFLSIWFVVRLRRSFDRSYEKTEDIFREAFLEAKNDVEVSSGDDEDDFRPRD